MLHEEFVSVYGCESSLFFQEFAAKLLTHDMYI